MLKKLKKDYRKYYNKNFNVVINIIRILLNPGFITIFLYRIANFLYELSPVWLYFFSKILMLIPRILFGIEIEIGAKIGGGLAIAHGVGIVIGSKVIIEENVDIYQGVTLGGNNKIRELKEKSMEQPLIKDNVRLAPGCKILGPVIIEKNCIIGANCVVTKDIPINSLVISGGKIIIKDREGGENDKIAE
ncbi:MAG: serine O-acetyltransferase [Cetobacterium sp.]